MNAIVKAEGLTQVRSREMDRKLSEADIEAMGAEFDALRDQVWSDLGEKDYRYIRRIERLVRYTGAAGRGLLFLSLFPPAWILGTLLLGLSKILENMELGHNVIHGQYNWTGSHRLQGNRYEWDNAGTADNWRKTHNFQHHTYTNIKGLDDDIGYGVMRLFPEQRWKPFYLFQMIYTPIFAILFQWGIAIQDLRLGRYFSGRKSKAELAREADPVVRKARRQILKDYVIFPLLAGPFFIPVFLGNLCANLIRNVWTFTIIFCGHFTENAEIFPRSVLNRESRGHWYLRQLKGSSNLKGPGWFHILSGNLSHQIEHHLFPDIPACRYAELAPRVKDICQRYGQHYNTGSFPRQAAQVGWRIIRHGFPSKAATSAPLA